MVPIKGDKTVKRKYRWLLSLILLLFCANATGVYAYLFVLSDDTTAPVLSVDSEVLQVSVEATDEELLQGVRATDNVDGDVTASVLVEGIGKMNENHEATITYAAFDSSDNVAKISRKVQFTDYEPPVFRQRHSLTFATNTSPDVLTYLTAYDMMDGDISRRIKGMLVSDTSSLAYSGIHQVEFRVTNSLGDTQHITLPVEVYEPSAYNATVDLGGDYLVYVKQGTAFKPAKYLKELNVGTESYSLENQNPPIENLTREEYQALGTDREQEVRTYINNYVDPEENEDPFVSIVNVEIENGVISSIPGVYSVTYTVNYENRYTGYARLNVVVEE